ncbi:MAG: WbqC family protein [candidate division WOR-3 bacterium]
MNKKVAIIQSSYIPWKGYFDIINMVDEFILYDDAQYTKRDWRNRNRIKTPAGLLWLTIPVKTKGRYKQKIKDTEVASEIWNKEHWKTISSFAYPKAKFFKEYKEIFEETYLNITDKYLSEINYKFIKLICKILNIGTKISWSMDYKIYSKDSTEKLIDLCKQSGANEYFSGPSAKAYIKEELFASEKIKLTYVDYSGYPEYEQLFPPFEHYVSIIDLIFNVGEEAPKYMKSF